MLSMAARKPGDPVVLFIFVITGNGLLHGSALFIFPLTVFRSILSMALTAASIAPSVQSPSMEASTNPSRASLAQVSRIVSATLRSALALFVFSMQRPLHVGFRPPVDASDG